MRKCKYIGSNERPSYLLQIGENYQYVISDEGEATGNNLSFPYHVYNFDSNRFFPVATFSKDYFDALFIDILEQRKQKIEKINSI